MDAETLLIDGPVGPLEVMITCPPELAEKRVVVICHPNPTQQGTMHNKVVTTIAKAYQKLNLATVRFNFRGVGKSAGEFDHTVGESDDLGAVLAWVRMRWPDFKIDLAGFSFGAYIAAKAAYQQSDIERLISIAPPINFYDFAALKAMHCPWLIVQGDADEVISAPAVLDFAKDVPAKLVVFPGIGHFFHGQLVELREQLVAWLIENDSH